MKTLTKLFLFLVFFFNKTNKKEVKQPKLSNLLSFGPTFHQF